MTHWKKLTNPNYFGTYALPDGKDVILTIDHCVQENVMNQDGKNEMCFVLYWLENAKPLIMNKTNLKMVQKVLGTPYIEEWNGKKIQLGASKVKAFGEVVDAIRVRDKVIGDTAPEAPKCDECGAEIQPMGNMSAVQVAEYTLKKYGKALCSECTTKAKEGKE